MRNVFLLAVLPLIGGCANADVDGGTVSDDPSATQAFGCDRDDPPGDEPGGEPGDEPPGDEPPGNACAASADGRAWGVNAEVLGLLSLPAFPDTKNANPQTLIDISAVLCTSCATLSIRDAVFSVESTGTSNAGSARNVAIATTNALAIALPNLHITATTLRARAEASATAGDVSTSTSGSLVQGLRINGIDYISIVEPLVVTITDPITCAPIAEVHLLETSAETTPLSSSVSVNALRIVVFDLALTPLIDESIDIVVAHAESAATIADCAD